MKYAWLILFLHPMMFGAMPELHATKQFHIPLKEKYVNLIKNHKKTVEGRINTGIFKALQPGDQVTFFSPNSKVLVHIKAKHIYRDFKQMLKVEGIANLLPGMTSISAAERIYQSFPGYAEKVRRFGAVALQLQIVE